MNIPAEIRRLRSDLLFLELREISALIDALELRVVTPAETADDPAAERHFQVLQAISRLADLDGFSKRIARIEAREQAT
jgi:hypothetical protein